MNRDGATAAKCEKVDLNVRPPHGLLDALFLIFILRVLRAFAVLLHRYGSG
jgi:hypothetical protein